MMCIYKQLAQSRCWEGRGEEQGREEREQQGREKTGAHASYCLSLVYTDSGVTQTTDEGPSSQRGQNHRPHKHGVRGSSDPQFFEYGSRDIALPHFFCIK